MDELKKNPGESEEKKQTTKTESDNDPNADAKKEDTTAEVGMLAKPTEKVKTGENQPGKQDQLALVPVKSPPKESKTSQEHVEASSSTQSKDAGTTSGSEPWVSIRSKVPEEVDKSKEIVDIPSEERSGKDVQKESSDEMLSPTATALHQLPEAVRSASDSRVRFGPLAPPPGTPNPPMGPSFLSLLRPAAATTDQTSSPQRSRGFIRLGLIPGLGPILLIGTSSSPSPPQSEAESPNVDTEEPVPRDNPNRGLFSSLFDSSSESDDETNAQKATLHPEQSPTKLPAETKEPSTSATRNNSGRPNWLLDSSSDEEEEEKPKTKIQYDTLHPECSDCTHRLTVSGSGRDAQGSRPSTSTTHPHSHNQLQGSTNSASPNSGLGASGATNRPDSQVPSYVSSNRAHDERRSDRSGFTFGQYNPMASSDARFGTSPTGSPRDKNEDVSSQEHYHVSYTFTNPTSSQASQPLSEKTENNNNIHSYNTFPFWTRQRCANDLKRSSDALDNRGSPPRRVTERRDAQTQTDEIITGFTGRVSLNPPRMARETRDAQTQTDDTFTNFNGQESGRYSIPTQSRPIDLRLRNPQHTSHPSNRLVSEEPNRRSSGRPNPRISLTESSGRTAPYPRSGRFQYQNGQSPPRGRGNLGPVRGAGTSRTTPANPSVTRPGPFAGSGIPAPLRRRNTDRNPEYKRK